MTPISFQQSNITIKNIDIIDVDTDYIIVGRALYNSEDIKKDIKLFLNNK